MRREHKPYWIKRLLTLFNHWYVEHRVRPHCDSLGKHPMMMHPRHIEIHGANIHIGDFVHMIGASDRKLRITTWGGKNGQGQIHIGNYCLISPGSDITAQKRITIGDNCMIAADCYLSDSDWHGVYNRLRPFRCTKPITLENNVWVGQGVKILKGVTIGENSVIAAGSIVTKSVPPNSIAGGNPAKTIKKINPKKRMLKRELLFRDPEHYHNNLRELDKFMLHGNSFYSWLKTLIKPSKLD